MVLNESIIKKSLLILSIFINIYIFFTEVISCHLKKWNRRLPTSPYTEWQGKKLQIKMVQNWILYKKVHERICLSPDGVELGPPKIDMVVILYGTETANYTQFRAPFKNTYYFKKSCSKLNFIWKSPWAHMSIFPRSGATGLERLIWLLYYMVLKLQITII